MAFPCLLLRRLLLLAWNARQAGVVAITSRKLRRRRCRKQKHRATPCVLNRQESIASITRVATYGQVHEAKSRKDEQREETKRPAHISFTPTHHHSIIPINRHRLKGSCPRLYICALGCPLPAECQRPACPNRQALGLGANEEPQRSGARRSQNQNEIRYNNGYIYSINVY